jgi:Ser/Thr protein kinase RdoA (MazF antagonist)
MIRAADESTARAALRRWRADPTPPAFVGFSASSVYAARIGGEACYLRLTDDAFRSRAEVESELAFVRHLHGRGARVSPPIVSRAGDVIEIVTSGSITFVATVFSAAPGLYVTPDSEDWDEPFFRAWGRGLALLHHAARGYSQPADVWRDSWRLEPVLRIGTERLRAGDPELAAAIDRIFQDLELRSRDLGDVGMIHADVGPQNFRYDRQAGITTFDFDNCCRHWLLYDLAVSLFALRARPDRARLRSWIVAGYREIAAPPGDLDAVGALFALRLLYILCDRALTAGPRPTAAQAAALKTLRDQIVGWHQQEQS